MSNFRLGDAICLFDFFADHSHLSNLELDKITEFFKTNESSQAVVGGGEYASGRIDPTIRKSNILWLDDHFMEKNKCLDIYKKIQNRLNEINEIAFKFDLLFIEPIQLTEYTSDQNGFYDYHTDAPPIIQNLSRKLSFVIQLSDPEDFEGGDFCVITSAGKEFNVTKERPDLLSKGSIIAFPSFLPHKVTPVTKGTRYSLVGWCNGPRFK